MLSALWSAWPEWDGTRPVPDLETTDTDTDTSSEEGGGGVPTQKKRRKVETKPRQSRFGYRTDAGLAGGGAASFRFNPADSPWHKLYLENPAIVDDTSQIGLVS